MSHNTLELSPSNRSQHSGPVSNRMSQVPDNTKGFRRNTGRVGALPGHGAAGSPA